jgi:hypothetical protein
MLPRWRLVLNAGRSLSLSSLRRILLGSDADEAACRHDDGRPAAPAATGGATAAAAAAARTSNE